MMKGFASEHQVLVTWPDAGTEVLQRKADTPFEFEAGASRGANSARARVAATASAAMASRCGIWRIAPDHVESGVFTSRLDAAFSLCANAEKYLMTGEACSRDMWGGGLSPRL